MYHVGFKFYSNLENIGAISKVESHEYIYTLKHKLFKFKLGNVVIYQSVKLSSRELTANKFKYSAGAERREQLKTELCIRHRDIPSRNFHPTPREINIQNLTICRPSV